MRNIIITTVLLSMVLGIGLYSQGTESTTPKDSPGKSTTELQAQVEKLIRELGDKDYKIREAATEKLMEIGHPALAQLQQASESKDPEVRMRVSRCMKVIDVKSRIHLPDKFLKEFPEAYKTLAFGSSTDQGALLVNLADADKDYYEVKKSYEEIFIEETPKEKLEMIFKEHDKNLTEIIKDLLKSESLTEEEIKGVLNLITGSRAIAEAGLIPVVAGHHYLKDSIPYIKKFLKHDKYLIRGMACGALARIGAKEAIPEIEKLLDDEEDFVRGQASWALSVLGKESKVPKGRLSKIMKQLESNIPDEVCKALLVLGDLGAKGAIPEITKKLKDKSIFVRRNAAIALGNLGAKEAVPEIVKLLKDESTSTHRDVAEALRKLISPEEIKPEIIQLLKDEDSIGWHGAVTAIEVLRLKELAPKIITFLESKDNELRIKTTQALGLLKVKEAIPKIIELLEDDIWSTRCYAVNALGEMSAKEAIPAIMKRLKDKDSSVRGRAIYVLGDLGAKEAIPDIIECLNNKDDSEAAAYALNQLTGRKFGKNYDKWLKWWQENKDKFGDKK